MYDLGQESMLWYEEDGEHKDVHFEWYGEYMVVWSYNNGDGENLVTIKSLNKTRKDKIFIVILAGILMMVIAMPTKSSSAKSYTTGPVISTGSEDYEKNLGEELQQMLENTDGVGKVKVLVKTNDTKNLIEAVESGKIGSVGTDCCEGEDDFIRTDRKYDDLVVNHDYIILKSFQNTIVTPHVAFFTDQAVSDMVESSVKSVVQFAAGEDTPLEVH